METQQTLKNFFGSTFDSVSTTVIEMAKYHFAENTAHVVGFGLVLLVMFSIKLYRTFRFAFNAKDGQRLFTQSQRAEGFARAGNRCENVMFVWFRCKSGAQHGDHHFPHSKGGATTMDNFVALCAKHNIAKSNKVPTKLETKWLESRRNRYFPESVSVSTGEWLKRSAKKESFV